MLERSKGCHNEGIMRSLQKVIKRPLKGIIPMRGFWWFIIHVPGMWHMAISPSGTLPGIICWFVPVTLPQVLLPLLLLSEICLLPSKVTGRFAHFPVRPESFRPESFRPRVVSPSITRVVSPSYPESFRPLFGESFRPLSKFIFFWGHCDTFTVFVSFNADFGYFSLNNDMSFISWSKWYIYLYSV